MSLTKEINEKLQQLNKGEKLLLTPSGCSINYLRQVVSSSPHGNFKTRYIKEFNQLEVTVKEFSQVFSAIGEASSEKLANIIPNESDDDEDFRGL